MWRNYWSDLIGVDEKSGSNQNETGSDGICDYSYDINENNTDRYPLMGPIPFSTLEAETEHHATLTLSATQQSQTFK